MFKVYLGAPIDTTSGDPGANFKFMGEILEKMAPREYVAYNPFTAFMGAQHVNTRESRRFVVDINMEAVEEADLGLFIWDGSSTFGVPVEIYRMADEDIPIILYATAKTGIYLQHVMEEGNHRNRIVHSDDEFKRAIREHFDNGRDKESPEKSDSSGH